MDDGGFEFSAAFVVQVQGMRSRGSEGLFGLLENGFDGGHDSRFSH
jgi:hypothetical protein